jgi:hypothetical protein
MVGRLSAFDFAPLEDEAKKLVLARKSRDKFPTMLSELVELRLKFIGWNTANLDVGNEILDFAHR